MKTFWHYFGVIIRLSAEAGTAQAEQRIEEAKVAHEKLLAEFKELQASQEELVRQVAVVSEARQATPHVVISKPPIPQVSDNVNNDETSNNTQFCMGIKEII